MKDELVEGEDFYYDGPYVVFTAKFLKDRGSCCESGCRHCPYGHRRDHRSDAPSTAAADDDDAAKAAD